jgi:hypothetical protein
MTEPHFWWRTGRRTGRAFIAVGASADTARTPAEFYQTADVLTPGLLRTSRIAAIRETIVIVVDAIAAELVALLRDATDGIAGAVRIDAVGRAIQVIIIDVIAHALRGRVP